jgi:rubrerythrin
MDRVLTPLHRWIWSDPNRRLQKLLRFSETETDGGRDLLRAAEVTSDPLLRRLYLVHATDEQRHGILFRRRASAMLRNTFEESDAARELASAHGHGLDDVVVDRETDETMLAFLHVAEKSAASRFSIYRDVLSDDPATQRVFEDILHDEKFHMNYTLTQLTRVSPKHHRVRIWRARLVRLWKAYLRFASGIAGIMGGAILAIQYFTILPPFAWLSKRAARREPEGWRAIVPDEPDAMTHQY